MARLQHQITINAPIEKVWGVLTDLEQVGAYNPLVKSVKYITDHKTGVGAARECQFEPKGSGKERVTAIAEMKSISMEMYESDWPLKFMNWTNYLTESNGTTSVKSYGVQNEVRGFGKYNGRTDDEAQIQQNTE